MNYWKASEREQAIGKGPHGGLEKKILAECLTDTWAYKMAARLKMKRVDGRPRAKEGGEVRRSRPFGIGNDREKAKVDWPRGMAHDDIRSVMSLRMKGHSKTRRGKTWRVVVLWRG